MSDGLRCYPCSRTFIDGRWRDLGPAAYWWVYDDGVRLPLCAHCCAAWRANSAEDPGMYGTPARIVQIAA